MTTHFASRLPSLRPLAIMAVVVGCWGMPALAQAQQLAAATAPEPDYRALAAAWAQTAVRDAAPAAAALRMEVAVGALDSRLRLAPCGNIEAYLPQGTRLWGRSRIGLRCIDGMARWNVTLPATVKAWGPAWVVRRPVAQGATITEADVTSAEVDWAEDTSPVLAERSAWLGHVATRALGTGMVVRQGLVKPAQVFQAGAQVRVVAQGVGFEISADAQALSAGVVGQPTRVRLDSGRVASGLVLDARTVKIDI